jgi:hypothetical protein
MISTHGYFPDLAGIAIFVHDFNIVKVTRYAIQRERVAGFDGTTAELISSPAAIPGTGKIELVDGKPGFVDDHELAPLRLCD